MSNLDNILKKITGEAEAKRETILNQAREEAQKILEAQRIKVDNQREQAIRKAEEEGKNIVNRLIAGEKNKIRNEILMAKQGILDRVFSLAKDDFKAYPADSIIKDIEKAKEELPDGEWALILPKRYEDDLNLQKLNAKFDESLSSGFKLIQGNVVYNYDYSIFVDAKREDIEGEIAEFLFSSKEV